MVEYIVFFGLLGLAVVCYVVYEFQPKPAVVGDYKRNKCESYIERRLYDALVLNGEVVNTQVPCGVYRIDLTLPAYNIAIEADGKEYHSSVAQRAHDRKKNAYLRKHGWKVLRFSGKQINGDLKHVLKRIDTKKNV